MVHQGGPRYGQLGQVKRGISADSHKGEPAHVAMRRIHLALARQEELLAQPEGKKDSKQGTKGYRPFPVAPWHVTQAGLWSLIGK